jgi:CHAD domain-containing protein
VADDLVLPTPVAVDAALTRPIAALRSLLGVDAPTDAESIHRARTATRRLRSNLRTLGEVLDPPDAVRVDLSWIADSLGAVRDVDVFAERLSDRLARAPEPIAAGARLVLRSVETERGAHTEQLRRDVASVRYGNLIHELDVIAKQGTSGVGTLDAPTVMRSRWRTLRGVAEATERAPTDRHLHEMRIQTKRVRYAAEIFAPTRDDRCRRFVRRATALQDVLGAQHDAVRACDWLLSTELDDPWAARAAGWLAAGAASEREALRDGWRAGWRALGRAKARFW